MSISEIEVTLRRKLENVELSNTTLREELDRVRTDNNSLVDENASLVDENTHTRKKVTSLQQEIANQHNEYSRIESEFYNQGQEIERLKKENITYLKNKREAERKLREETLAFEKDRLGSQEREAELIEQLKAVQETVSVLAQQEFQKKQDQEFRKKHSQYSSNGEVPTNTYSLISMFSPSSALSSIAARLSTTTGDETVTDNPHNAARDAKIAQRTVKEQERLINQLKTEIENAKQQTTDSLTHGKDLLLKITQLENELEQVKRVKRSLEEENEGFQLLLHEKTIKGEFMLNPIMQRHDSLSSRRRYTKHGKEAPASNDLAAELDRASAGLERVQKESDQITDEEEEVKSIKEENKSLKDDNKSLRLYIQKILDRIMDVNGYEEILSTEWSKKPPSQPNTPTVTTFSHVRSQSKQSNLIPEDKEAAAKKIERRKTLSGAFSFRGSKLNNIKIPPNNADEIQDQLSPLASSPTAYFSSGINADDKTDRLNTVAEVSEAPKTRHLRRNSSSDGGTRKRWSMWWNQPKPEEKKEDPFMRPIVLVQENEKTKG